MVTTLIKQHTKITHLEVVCHIQILFQTLKQNFEQQTFIEKN